MTQHCLSAGLGSRMDFAPAMWLASKRRSGAPRCSYRNSSPTSR
jgi:hypothetical protein